MGAADCQFQVCGGTVAFLMGTYDPLIESLNGITPASCRLLLTGRGVAFFHAIRGHFLLPLLLGMFTAYFFLANSLDLILHTPAWRELFFFYFHWPYGCFSSPLFCAGASMGKMGDTHGTTRSFSSFLSHISWSKCRFSSSQFLILEGWVFLSGAVAIVAMLLPGISGSSFLNVIGVFIL